MSALSVVLQRYNDCVFGYVRSVQHLLPMTSAYYNIPSLVTFLILEYFYIKETFDIHGDKIELDETLMIASSPQLSGLTYIQNSVFGRVVIDFDQWFIYRWELKILNGAPAASYHGAITVGIVATECIDDCKNGNFTDNPEDYFVAYYSRSDLIFEIAFDEYAKNKGEPYGVGDVIKMEINTKDKTIEFAKNNKSFGVLKPRKANVEVIDPSKTYQLAVAVGSDNVVQVIHFEQITVE